MTEENISQEFRLKNIVKTKNYFTEEIKWNVMITKKLKKVCTTLNYIKYLLVLTPAVSGRVSISAFASLVDTPIGSAVELSVCAITAGIKSKVNN